jgi:hypothetical protein
VKRSLPLKIDLHMHTHYSEDATITLKEVICYAKKRGLDGFAITDHNTITGALKLIGKSELTIVPGVEIETLGGHVLALNVKTPIRPKLNVTETVEKIHSLGGIAVVAHPTAVFKARLTQDIASSNFDAVEVINSAAFPFSFTTRMNIRLAERLKLPKTAGSDAHHFTEIGSAFTLIDADPNLDDVIDAIMKGATIPWGKPIRWVDRFWRGAFYIKRKRMGNYSSESSI